MNRNTLLVSCLVIASIISTAALGSWKIGPLSERVKGADLIVIGELTDVTQHSFSLCYGHSAATYYDVAVIKNPKVLKGKLDNTGFVRVAYHSVRQDQKNGFRHMLSPHKEGERGIWLLYKDKVLTGYYFAMGPANPLSETEEEVIKAIQESEPEKNPTKRSSELPSAGATGSRSP